jgi:hypothetical protein
MKFLKSEAQVIDYLKRLREQAAPEATPAEPAPAPAAAPAAQPETSTQAAKPITVDDIIDKLNIVRSGRSTKDSEVKRELDEYIAQFDEDEKTALLAFLEGLGQILTSGVDSDDAADPADPYALQIKKSLGASAANAVKSPTPAAAAPTAPTPGPVPIKIGGA